MSRVLLPARSESWGPAIREPSRAPASSRIGGRVGRPSGRRARFCVPQAVGGSGSRRFAAAAATMRHSLPREAESRSHSAFCEAVGVDHGIHLVRAKREYRAVMTGVSRSARFMSLTTTQAVPFQASASGITARPDRRARACRCARHATEGSTNTGSLCFKRPPATVPAFDKRLRAAAGTSGRGREAFGPGRDGGARDHRRTRDRHQRTHPGRRWQLSPPLPVPAIDERLLSARTLTVVIGAGRAILKTGCLIGATARCRHRLTAASRKARLDR